MFLFGNISKALLLQGFGCSNKRQVHRKKKITVNLNSSVIFKAFYIFEDDKNIFYGNVMDPLPEKCLHNVHKRYLGEPVNVLENLNTFLKLVSFSMLNTSELFSPWGLSSEKSEL